MRITWDLDGTRTYETGVDHGVLYLKTDSGQYVNGKAWNGLTGVTESPSGAESNPLYADNIKYLNLRSVEEFGFTIEAYSYPPEFAQCDGTAELVKGVVIGQQARKPFGFSYRTKLGNDTRNEDYGYKLHLVYGCDASPSDRSYSTINDSPDAITFSWEVTTTPVNVPGFNPTSLITIDSTQVDPDKLKALEDILYGTDAGTTFAVEGEDGETNSANDARLPLPDEIATLFAEG